MGGGPGAGGAKVPDRTPGRSREAEPGGSESGGDDQDKPKGYATILEEEIWQGLSEMERPTGGLALSGLSAGLDIGFSVLLMATVLTILGGDLGDPTTRLMVASMYPVGFVFVILGRSELFTEHTTLAVFPVLGGRASVTRLARLWAIVYAANIVGAAIFSALAAWIGPALGAFEPDAAHHIASKLTDHTALVILGSAVLAGWMMGLLSWLLSASRETVSRIIVVFLVTAAIGVAGLHHCVVGSVEVLVSVFLGGASMADFGHFLLWSSLGNAAGGVFFVAVIKYSHAVKGPTVPPVLDPRV